MTIALLTPRAATGAAAAAAAARSLTPAVRARLLPWLLVGLGGVLVPWLGTLAAAGQWNWVGLDSAEAAGLVVTGLLLRRADRRHGLTAAVTAVLLLTDAGSDTATAAPGPDLAVALAMALLVEFPLALLCAGLAVRALRNVRSAPPSPLEPRGTVTRSVVVRAAASSR